jgi:CHAT domain-containing protein
MPVEIARARLESLVAAHRAEALRGAPGEAARELWRVMQIEQALAGRRKLALVLDGILHGVAPGALRDANGRTIAERGGAVSVLPSLTIGRLASQLPAPRGRTLLVGVSRGDAALNLPWLPAVSREIDGLVRLYPQATVLREAAAVPDRVRDAVAGAGVIHFASHAHTDVIRPARSRLLLAAGPEGGELSAAGISALRITPGAIVVLSACGTAAGSAPHGEGTLSLARSFLAAGAGAVVAAGWPVADDEASLVMGAFHRQLVLGHGAGEALRLALLEHATAIRSAASFVVIGGGGHGSLISKGR